MKKSSLLFLMILIITIHAVGQINDSKIRTQLLQLGKTDSHFIFGKWNEKGETETHLRYLGKILTNKGKTIKIINSTWFWGLSHHATSRILIFDDKNRYLGNYYMGSPDELPTKLVGKTIFFSNTNTYNHSTPKISFDKGIPKEFFVKDNGKYGNIYNFDSSH